MKSPALCYDCERGRHSHWSEDDGATQSCAMPLSEDASSACECGVNVAPTGLSCVWCGGPVTAHDDDCRVALRKQIAELCQPIPMIICCPKCGLQHIDTDDETGNWATSRHHRKHLCKPDDGGCGHVWMVAGVPTVGVVYLAEEIPA